MFSFPNHPFFCSNKHIQTTYRVKKFQKKKKLEKNCNFRTDAHIFRTTKKNIEKVKK